MKYDYESTKARSPNVDKFYFCGSCGDANSPYKYPDLQMFQKQCKVNRCPKCQGKEDNLFGEKVRIEAKKRAG